MKTITITPEQESIILDALRERIGKLYQLADNYKCNKEAVMDCLDEAKRVRATLEDFKRQTNN